MKFIRQDDTDIYVSDASQPNSWSAFYYLGRNFPTSISLEDAHVNYPGHFLFAPKCPEDIVDFNLKVQSLGLSSEQMIWLKDPNEPGPLEVLSYLIFYNSSELDDMKINLTDVLFMENSTWFPTIELDRNTSTFKLHLLYLNYKDTSSEQTLASTPQAHIHFAGPNTGCLTFNMKIRNCILNKYLFTGFHTGYNPSPGIERLGIYPLIYCSSQNSTEYQTFKITIDPCHIFSDPKSRTELSFTTSKKFVTQFRTSTGLPLYLQPVLTSEVPPRLFFSNTVTNKFTLSPVGDFSVSTSQNDTKFDIMGGLSGSECIRCYQQDIIRFEYGYGAFATYTELGELVFREDYVTSWTRFLRKENEQTTHPTSEIRYVGEPEALIRYGKNPVVSTIGKLLGSVDPGYALPPNCIFPLFPYADVLWRGRGNLTKDEYIKLERLLVFDTRRNLISESQRLYDQSRPIVNTLATTGSGTTSAGSIVEWNDYGRWNALKIVNYCSIDKDEKQQFQIENPTLELQQAFQTDQLFLVVADNQFIGHPSSSTRSAPLFHNKIDVEQWAFQLNIEPTHTEGKYSNVMIVKGCKGKLKNYVLSPDKWTMPDKFSTSDAMDLSQWLNTELETIDPKHPGFAKLREIIDQEDWVGTLMLHVDVQKLPTEIQVLESWLEHKLYAHHIIIDKTPVDTEEDTLKQKDVSSMVGLIYYVDPNEPSPVSRRDIPDFDFKIQELVVYFEGSEIKTFNLKAQLTINSWFHDSVDSSSMNTITLHGSRLILDGRIRYQLAAPASANFVIENSVFQDIRVSETELVTNEKYSFIKLNVYLNFNALTLPDGQGVQDIFGFSSLRCVGIKLDIDPLTKIFTFNPTELKVDLDASSARPGSTKQQLMLQLDRFISGIGNDPLAQLGALKIGTDLSPVSTTSENEVWYALCFRIHLGSLGELSGKANLKSDLFIVWRPGSRVELGITIPGLAQHQVSLALQGIMKLSLDEFHLKHTDGRFSIQIPSPKLTLLGRTFSFQNSPISEKPLVLFGQETTISGLEGDIEELPWYGVFK